MAKRTFIAIDVETTGLNPRKDQLHGLGVAYEEDQCEYYRTPVQASTWAPIIDLLRDPNIDLVGHNLRFDLSFLAAAGIPYAGRLWDTKLLAQLVNENQLLGLKDLAERHLGEWSLEKKRAMDQKCSQLQVKGIAELCAYSLSKQIRVPEIEEYCTEDCNNTLKLFYLFGQRLREVSKTWSEKFNAKKTPLDYYIEEAMLLEPVLQNMEDRGIRINLPRVHATKKEIDITISYKLTQLNELCLSEIKEIEEELYCVALEKRKSPKGKASVKRSSDEFNTRFNWQSTKHVSSLFYTKLDFPIVAKTKGGASALDKAVIEKLKSDHKSPILDTYSQYVQLKDQKKTFIGDSDKGLLSHVEDGRVYGRYVSTGTVTGRLSSKNPNMQNIPRKGPYRSFFVPDTPDHVFLYFDYSQLEYRLAAHLSQDPDMINDYMAGLDLHTRTAQEEGIERQQAKIVNFLIIYRGGAFRLQQQLGESFSMKRCYSIIDNFKSRYPVFEEYLQNQEKFMCRYGCVINELGRVRRLPDLLRYPPEAKEFKHALKQGFNFPIQSLGASITKRAMIALHKKDFIVCSQVHDSVLCQIYKSDIALAEQLRDIVQTIYKLRVPLVADVKILTSMSEHDILNIQTKE